MCSFGFKYHKSFCAAACLLEWFNTRNLFVELEWIYCFKSKPSFFTYMRLQTLNIVFGQHLEKIIFQCLRCLNYAVCTCFSFSQFLISYIAFDNWASIFLRSFFFLKISCKGSGDLPRIIIYLLLSNYFLVLLLRRHCRESNYIWDIHIKLCKLFISNKLR